jgi:excisionase family DNA binding protein
MKVLPVLLPGRSLQFRLSKKGGPMPQMKSLVDDQLLPVPEVADLLHCSIDVVYALVRQRKLGSTRGGRRILVPRSALNSYLVGQYAEAR